MRKYASREMDDPHVRIMGQTPLMNMGGDRTRKEGARVNSESSFSVCMQFLCLAPSKQTLKLHSIP